MRPLSTTKQILIWLCMYPAHESSSRWRKTAYCAFGLAIFCINLFTLFAHLAFFIKFVSSDVYGSFFAFMAMDAVTGMCYTMMIAFIMRHQIQNIFERLAKIYKDCESFEFMVIVSISNFSII